MRCRLVIAILLAASAARADRTPITLGDVLAAVRKAPAAAIPGHELAAAEASVDAASAWPSPSVRAGTNRLTARLVLGATIPLPIFGTVAANERQAAAEAEVVRADGILALRTLRYRVVVGWVQLARADGDVVATSIAAQHAAELELIAKGRLSAGTGADVDVTVASAARARADVAAEAAQRADDAASAALAGVLGWDPAVLLQASGTPEAGGADALESLRKQLGKHPERAAALRRIDAAEASLNQILTQRYPTLAVEGSMSFDDPSLDQVGQPTTTWQRTDAFVGVNLELPLFARTGDKARAAREVEAAQRARLAVTDTQLAAELVAAYRNWQAASERLRALEHDVVPAQERAAALSAQAFREGARDLASALQAERDLAAVRADVNAARADAATAFADLQLAAGAEVGDAK